MIYGNKKEKHEMSKRKNKRTNKKIVNTIASLILLVILAIASQNENFQNLQDYILYLQTNVTGRRLRNTNFDMLRNIMRTEYPAEQVYF